MTAYTIISNALVEVGAYPFATTVQALRDNVLAIAEKDTSVPSNLRLGDWLLGTLVTTSGASQTLSGLDLTNYSKLEFVAKGISHNSGTSQSFSIGGLIVVGSAAAAAVYYGRITVDLSTGRISGFWARDGDSATTIQNYQGNTGYSNATTSVTVSVSGGAFDLGAIEIRGIR